MVHLVAQRAIDCSAAAMACLALCTVSKLESARHSQGWIIDAMEVLVVAFVLEKVAVSFDLSSVGKGLVGSMSFLGE